MSEKEGTRGRNLTEHLVPRIQDMCVFEDEILRRLVTVLFCEHKAKEKEGKEGSKHLDDDGVCSLDGSIKDGKDTFGEGNSGDLPGENEGHVLCPPDDALVESLPEGGILGARQEPELKEDLEELRTELLLERFLGFVEVCTQDVVANTEEKLEERLPCLDVESVSGLSAELQVNVEDTTAEVGVFFHHVSRRLTRAEEQRKVSEEFLLGCPSSIAMSVVKDRQQQQRGEREGRKRGKELKTNADKVLRVLLKGCWTLAIETPDAIERDDLDDRILLFDGERESLSHGFHRPRDMSGTQKRLLRVVSLEQECHDLAHKDLADVQRKVTQNV